jgi:DNA processing protein
MRELTPLPQSLKALKKSPKQLFYRGDSTLLQKQKVSIVGTRHPNQYTKEMTIRLAQQFAALDMVVVSGAAMGVDALAHRGAFPNTIAVMANSLDISYPAINKKLIQSLHNEALTLSEYPASTRATKYSFVVRNRIVVALGEVLIITQADENSGTMRSAEIALEMGKKIYVLSHRVGESLGTQKLLAQGAAEVITDIDAFVEKFGKVEAKEEDRLSFFKDTPTLKESIAHFGDELYELELEGKIIIQNLRVRLA